MHQQMCFMYCSVLAPGAGAAGVGTIVKTAREFNGAHGITGLLVFDGERFCQYIEGPASAMQGLVEKLEADSRHTDFTPLHFERRTDAGRRFPGWSMGYADVGGDHTIDGMAQLAADEALEKLQALSRELDCY
ncbi:MAG: BLUF domain-containing protein [Comamonas sp.]